MVIAQRGAHLPSYDFASFANGAENKVMRFWREKPDDPITPGRWKPVGEDYAIGFAEQFDNTNGGIDLGYGYNKDGQIDYSQCRKLLWASGDALRDNPNYVDFLSNGGELILNGLQASPFNKPKPENTPPYESAYVDYQANLYDPFAPGSIGDVDIFRTGCAKPEEPPEEPEEPDLEIEKEAESAQCDPGGKCHFTVTIRNLGPGDFVGSLVFIDTPATPGSTLIDWQPSPPWNCFDNGGSYLCEHPPIVMAAGDEVSVDLTFQVPFNITETVYENCVEIQWTPEGDIPSENDDPVDIAELQQLLSDAGYDPGPVDGTFGNKTRLAVEELQRDLGLNPTGQPTADLIEALRQDNLGDEDPVEPSDDPVGDRNPSNDRDCAEVDIPGDDPQHSKSMSAFHTKYKSSWHLKQNSIVHFPRVSRIHLKYKSAWHKPKTSRVHNPIISNGNGHRKIISRLHKKYKSSWHVKGKSIAHNPTISRIHLKYKSAWHKSKTSRIHNPSISDGNGHRKIISRLHKKYKSSWHVKGKSIAHNPTTSRIHLKYKSAWHKSKTSRVHNPTISDGNGHRKVISNLHKKYKSSWHKSKTSRVHNPIVSDGNGHRKVVSNLHKKYKSSWHKSKTSRVHNPIVSDGNGHRKVISRVHQKYKSSWHNSKTTKVHNPAVSSGHRKVISRVHQKYKSSWHNRKTSKVHNPAISNIDIHTTTKSGLQTHSSTRSNIKIIPSTPKIFVPQPLNPVQKIFKLPGVTFQ